MDHKDELHELQGVLDAMPPVRAMRIRAASATSQRLTLHAPLDANVNDKACAFGGSLASIMTLAAWGLCWRQARAADWKAEIFVADSQLDYLKPLYEDLHAEAWLDTEQDWEGLLRIGRERGRCRALLHAEVRRADGVAVCRMRARYALIATDRE